MASAEPPWAGSPLAPAVSGLPSAQLSLSFLLAPTPREGLQPPPLISPSGSRPPGRMGLFVDGGMRRSGVLPAEVEVHLEKTVWPGWPGL